MQKISRTIFISVLIILVCSPTIKTMTEREPFLNNPLTFINKTVTLNIFFTSINKDKKILNFLPDRARRMPQCQIEITYKSEAPVLEQFYFYQITFKVTNAEKSNLPLGRRNWNFFVRGELVSFKPGKDIIY